MIESFIRPALIGQNNGYCISCYIIADQLDHIKPRHAGGDDKPWNILPLCSRCNSIKSCLWPGHGYHPIDGFNDMQQAIIILAAEIQYQEDTLGPDFMLRVFNDWPSLTSLTRCKWRERRRYPG